MNLKNIFALAATGISASMGIAEYVAEFVKIIFPNIKEKLDFSEIKMPVLGPFEKRIQYLKKLSEKNHEYGEIVCHCEKVTKGELKSAMRSIIPPSDLEGLKRRTHCLSGKCQGFYCLNKIITIMAEEKRIPVSSLV